VGLCLGESWRRAGMAPPRTSCWALVWMCEVRMSRCFSRPRHVRIQEQKPHFPLLVCLLANEGLGRCPLSRAAQGLQYVLVLRAYSVSQWQDRHLLHQADTQGSSECLVPSVVDVQITSTAWTDGLDAIDRVGQVRGMQLRQVSSISSLSIICSHRGYYRTATTLLSRSDPKGLRVGHEIRLRSSCCNWRPPL
jgi:hypothetical protein